MQEWRMNDNTQLAFQHTLGAGVDSLCIPGRHVWSQTCQNPQQRGNLSMQSINIIHRHGLGKHVLHGSSTPSKQYNSANGSCSIPCNVSRCHHTLQVSPGGDRYTRPQGGDSYTPPQKGDSYAPPQGGDSYTPPQAITATPFHKRVDTMAPSSGGWLHPSTRG